MAPFQTSAATGLLPFAIGRRAGTEVVPTSGRQVPGSPKWLKESVVSATFGMGDVRFVGDHTGRRYAPLRLRPGGAARVLRYARLQF